MGPIKLNPLGFLDKKGLERGRTEWISGLKCLGKMGLEFGQTYPKLILLSFPSPHELGCGNLTLIVKFGLIDKKRRK